MNREQPARPRERLVPAEGPIQLWPDGRGEERWGLLLDVNVCPFPGCPERHVVVDGFRVEGLRHASARPGLPALDGGAPEEGEPDWAFVVSVDVDPPGEVHVEKCRDREALRCFTEALDPDLRAALLERFELQRAGFDAVLRKGAPATRDGSSLAVTYDRSGWSSEPLSPDRLVAVLAGMERAVRDTGRLRRKPFQSDPVRASRTGRNEPCPCGSGRKYKRCCLGTA